MRKKILENEHGACFPDKPYFPMYLGNGVDAMLVNVTGSGNPWSLAFAGRFMQAVGWYKCDRRTHRNNKLVYGVMLPLLDFTSHAILNGDTAVPRDTEQVFDPRKATLTTIYSQVDNQTLARMRVRVTTFLTADHVLVERYEILEAPPCGVPLRFTVQSPPHHHLNLSRNVVYPDRKTMAVDADETCLRYDFAYDEERLHGRALCWTDAAIASARIVDEDDTGEWQCVRGEIQTRALHAGDAVVRYLAVLDCVDDPDYQAALDRLMESWRANGYALVRAKHEEDWDGYFGRSSIEIPRPDLQHLYEVSRYVIRANHHPRLGYQPVGNLPYLWGGAMFWDASFALSAFLGCGHREEAFRMIAFLRSLLPQARALARRLSAAGARLEWTTGTRDFTPYPDTVTQFHNNSVWAHAVYQCYAYTGDRAFLADAIDLMEELLVFMVDRCVVGHGDYLVMGECEGIDESVSQPKVNDTWTCAVTLKALEEYRCACAVLERPSRIEDLDRIIEGLARGLDANVDRDGVLQGFAGGKLPHWGCLVFDLFPEHPALEPTVREMMKNRDAEMDVYNFHAVTRYAEKGFPWAQYWAVRILSRTGNPQASALLDNAAESVGYFGSIPERVWYHGEFVNEWFSTGSAAMVWAVHGLLANVTGGELRLLSGAAHAWKDVAFSGIHAGSGIVVSAKVLGGEIEALSIENKMAREQMLRLRLGEELIGDGLTLQPGANRLSAGGRLVD
ncbi:MAG: hypothetical protein PHR35_14850 [Kiritimatiellae bacterium]|nr:hypothetical protein [Kiritimatiellia bacterium]